MIELTIDEVFRIEQALKRIDSIQLKGAIAFQLARFNKAIRPILESAETGRNAVLMRFAKRNPNGEIEVDEKTGNVVIPKDKMDDCMKEMNELFGQKVSLEMNKLPSSFVDDVFMAPRDIEALLPLIEE